MGYHVTLYAGWERTEEGIRRGTGALVTATCSGITPNRQQRVYGVDFTDLLSYFIDGVAYNGDPEIENQAVDDANGVWTPDWEAAQQALEKLTAAAIEAGDEYTLTRLPEWRQIVEIGSRTPGAVIGWSF